MGSIPFLSNLGMTAIWILALVIFLYLEVMSAGTLVSIWFCVGALAGAGMSVMDFSKSAQMITFALTSALALLLLRPMAARYLNKDFQPTNADRIIGQQALVTEKIDKLAGTGTVKVDGKTWTAINVCEGESIHAGEEVTIEEIKGVKVFVKKVRKGV